MTPRPSLHLLVGAYAVNALDADERERFEHHLAHCPDCAEELTGLRDTAGRLAELTAAEPPPALRAQVLTEIGQARPLPPLSGRVGTGRRRGSHRVLLALVAAVVILVAATGAVTLWPSDTARTTAASIQQAPDAKQSVVESDAGWSASVWHSDSLRQAMLVVDGMPAPPTGMVHQVWFDQPSSGMVSAGLLPREDGDQTIVLAGDAATADGVRITLEPVGGSDRPTSEPIAVFDFGRAAS